MRRPVIGPSSVPAEGRGVRDSKRTNTPAPPRPRRPNEVLTELLRGCGGAVRHALVFLEQLFQRIVGEGRLRGLSRPIPEESWPHRAQEILAFLRHRARDDSRRLAPSTRRERSNAAGSPEQTGSAP